MPYVVGTYRDKLGSMDCLIGSDAQKVAECRQSIRWQVGPGQSGLACRVHPGGEDMRTAWHVADPAPASPFTMVCRDCGAELHITRGAFAWDAFHRISREIWSGKVPLTVAEFRLSLGEH